MLAIAAQEKLNLAVFDITTAFLLSDIDHDIYMKQPYGFEDGSNKVCKLNKALYGCRQSPKQ